MDKFTLAVVGGVLALVVAGLVAAAMVRGTARPPDLGTPSGVVLAYALAEQRGDGQAAWDLLSASAQARGDRDRFLARAGLGMGDNVYFTTEDERLDDSGASVTLVRTYVARPGILGAVTSYSTRSVVRLTREAAGWRISVPPDDFLLTVPPPPREPIRP